MMNNKLYLEYLSQNRQTNLNKTEWFDTPPRPMPLGFDFERIEGMMLGLAIGDSLGNTTEGWRPEVRAKEYGEIRDYLPNRYAEGKSIGIPADDTQLAFWTLEQLIVDGNLNPEHLAQRFSREKIFGIGGTVREFLKKFKGGHAWYESGCDSAGNGALMRIAPMLIPHLKSATTDLWVDTAISAMITHNDSASSAACLSFINMLWQLLPMKSPPGDPRWWLETYVNTSKNLEINSGYSPRTHRIKFKGFLWEFVEKHVSEAFDKGLSVREACDSWFSGAYLLETVPSVLYILMKHGQDPEEAIVRAVNDTKDNDTIAAIVGAAVGALHGKNGLPQRWIQNLSGRTGARDDGRIFDLLNRANEIWGS